MSSRSPRVGLLPLFLNLYNEVLPEEDANGITAFADLIRREYGKRGVEVIPSAACCEAEQFSATVHAFEAADVDAIITLHLAYSPSLESIDALVATDLPLILLDTTPDSGFGFEQAKERILFNHGIHGVQDLCNLLIRRGKSFLLEAGHWKKSDVLDRTLSALKGCRIAKALKNARVGIVGEPFKGMGDFLVPFDVLKREIGMEVIPAISEEIAAWMPATDAPDVRKEIEADRTRFATGEYTDESLLNTEAAGLGLRRWMEEESLSACTLNFSDITGAPGLPVVPFLEVSKAMARGIGYGGEGDVLTAAFCGALMQVVPETTFTEMFCPDWDGNRIFMSHMGELNVDTMAGTPVLEQRPYPFSAADEPIIASGCLKPGTAWFLNIAPGRDDSFSLVAAPVKVCNSGGREKIDGGIRGWIQPPVPVAEFLKQYSLAGGTHHGVLCYGIDEHLVEAFAKTMNWKYRSIQ
ncbi:MAG: hypothetical protein ABFR33_09000 [Verrucomicrobiota bacterium]